MTVAALEHALSSRELAEWQMYYRLEAEDAQRAALDAKVRAQAARKPPSRVLRRR